MIISKNEQIEELQCVLEENVKELESLQECNYYLLAKLKTIFIFLSVYSTVESVLYCIVQ